MSSNDLANVILTAIFFLYLIALYRFNQ